MTDAPIEEPPAVEEQREYSTEVHPKKLDPKRDRLPSGAKISILSEHMGKRFWMMVSAILLAGLIAEPLVLVPMLRKDQLVIALDGANTFHIGPGVEFLKSEDMMTSNALTATYALMMKSPVGFELPEILTQVFTATAAKRAEEGLDQEVKDLKDRRMSVKPNVSKIEIVSVDEESAQTRFLIRVTGQLRYNGQSAGQLFEFYNDFTLLLRMVKNPKLTLNKRFPLVVYDWDLRTTPGVKSASEEPQGIKQEAMELLKKSEAEKRSPDVLTDPQQN